MMLCGSDVLQETHHNLQNIFPGKKTAATMKHCFAGKIAPVTCILTPTCSNQNQDMISLDHHSGNNHRLEESNDKQNSSNNNSS